MGDLESIRDIARRLVAEFRLKKSIPKVERYVAQIPVPEKATSVAVADPMFNGLDREWLKKLGIEA